MEENHQLYQIALTLLDGIGSKKAKLLLAYLGGVDKIFDPKTNLRTTVPGFSKAHFKNLDRKKALDDAAKIVKEIEKKDIKTVFLTDKNFPHRLKECDDGPVLTYYKGNFDFNPKKTLAIVGTRNMTTYGKQLINELLESLEGYNVQVISGLALGVDGYAHKKCLEMKIPTIGVLGHGLDRIYPRLHYSLAERMVQKQGCGLLTEFPNNTRPDRENFPQRNRIVAGMADATIVIESGQKGGSLITAHLANDYNRDVFTYPGDVNRPYSRGCNQLITTNKAHLITCGEDFIRLMEWEKGNKQIVKQTNLFTQLTGDEKKVITTLQDFDKMSLDVMSIRLKKPVNLLSPLLLALEIKGLIMTLPGKNYSLARV